MDYIVDEMPRTLYFWFASNLDETGTDATQAHFRVRKAGALASDGPVYNGIAIALSHPQFPNGCYECMIDVSEANGYIRGETYSVFSTLTINSHNPTGFIGSFRILPVVIPPVVPPVVPSDPCTGGAGFPVADLLALAGKSQTITVDGQTVTRRSLSEVIAMDRYLISRKTQCVNGQLAGLGWNNIVISQAVLPASVGGV